MRTLTELKTPEDKFTRAIADLQLNQPFFAHLAVRLNPQPANGQLRIPTMGVDAKGNLYYEKDFVMNMDQDELMGVVCHETLHVGLLHMLRMGNRVPAIANVAMDCVVNMMVRKTNLRLPSETIPVDTYNDSAAPMINGVSFSISDVTKKSWEQVYDELCSKMRKKQMNPESFRGKTLKIEFDVHMPGTSGDGDDDELRRELETKWQQALADAANYAKQQGKLPSGMDRIIDGILKPKVQWKQLLLKYLRPHLAPVDWTYQRPHKKSQVLEVFLPNTLKESCMVEVIVDTSGSISGGELKEFLSEIVAIAQSMQHLKMWVTFVDARVDESARYEVENGDIPKILSMKPQGGGGTDMEAGLDYIKQNNPTIPVAVVLTDGYTSFNRKRHDYPFEVIWVVTKNGLTNEDMKRQIPYGLTVKMD